MSRRFILILLLGILICSQTFADGEDWIPESRHYEAASQGADCAIYRSIATKSRVSLSQAEDAELHHSEMLKVRRADLAACAEMHRIELNRSQESEELAAEACPEAYDQWIRTGYRLRSVLQDRDGARRSLEVIQANLDRSCGDPSGRSPSILRVQ